MKNCTSIASSALHSDGSLDQKNLVYRRSDERQADSQQVQLSPLKMAHEA
jgi:hypothetical protein